MKKILTFQNEKKKWLSAQEIYDNIDTTGYEVLMNQDTWSSVSNINAHDYAGTGLSDTYEEILYIFFVFNNVGEFDYYEAVIPHSVVAQSAFPTRETRTNSSLQAKGLFDTLTTHCSGATQYEPAEKGGQIKWNTVQPENSKWILMRKVYDTNIREQNITRVNNTIAFLPRKIPLCMNISDYSLSAGEFEKLYKFNHILKLKDL